MDLVQFLYVVMHYYLSGGQKMDPEGKVICNKLLDTTFPVSIPYLGDVMNALNKNKEIDYGALSYALKQYVQEYKSSPQAKLSFATVISRFATWFKNDSPGAMKALLKTSSLCTDPYIRNLLDVEVIDQKKVKNQLLKVNKNLGFGGTTVLDADQSKVAKAADPDVYKDYLALRRMHTQAWKNEVSDMVRASGKKTLPYKQVMDALAKKGIEHTQPTGFTGRIDADSNWYTNDDKLINGVPNASMFPEVIMNDDQNGGWVCQAVRKDGTMGGYFYAKGDKLGKDAHKFEFTGNFIKKLPGYRRKWLANIKNPFDYTSINEISSVCIELMFLSSQRVGTQKGGNSSGTGFGMSSILCKMVTIREDKSFLISYAGKDGIPFKFVLTPGSATDKIICEVMEHLKSGKKPSDPIFTRELKNGSWSQLSSGSITKYFKSITGGANIHKLRTAAGTGLFEKIVEGYYARYGNRKMKPANVMELCKAAATKVAKQLGHYKRDATGNLSLSPATSLKNYIDPDLQVQLFQHFGVPIPTYLEKMLETEKTITSRVLSDATVPNGVRKSDDNTTDGDKDGKEKLTMPPSVDNDRSPDDKASELPDNINHLIEKFLSGEEQLYQGV